MGRGLNLCVFTPSSVPACLPPAVAPCIPIAPLHLPTLPSACQDCDHLPCLAPCLPPPVQTYHPPAIPDIANIPTIGWGMAFSVCCASYHFLYWPYYLPTQTVSPKIYLNLGLGLPRLYTHPAMGLHLAVPPPLCDMTGTATFWDLPLPRTCHTHLCLFPTTFSYLPPPCIMPAGSREEDWDYPACPALAYHPMPNLIPITTTTCHLPFPSPSSLTMPNFIGIYCFLPATACLPYLYLCNLPWDLGT